MITEKSINLLLLISIMFMFSNCKDMNQKKKFEFTGDTELLSNLQVNVNVLYDKGNKLKTLFYKNQEMSQKEEKRVIHYIFYFNYNNELFNIIDFDDFEHVFGFEKARIISEIKQENRNVLIEMRSPVGVDEFYSLIKLLPYEEMMALHSNDELLHINNFQEQIFEQSNP